MMRLLGPDACPYVLKDHRLGQAADLLEIPTSLVKSGQQILSARAPHEFVEASKKKQNLDKLMANLRSVCRGFFFSFRPRQTTPSLQSPAKFRPITQA
jgi:hypothetical protein